MTTAAAVPAPRRGPFREGWSDIRRALAMHRVWRVLAAEDIGDQHRRTTLGPFWLLLNFLITLAIFIFLFQRGGGAEHYASYAATGLIVWALLGEILTSASTLFVREEGMIKGTRLPLSLFAFRLVMQTTIRMGYVAAGSLIVLLLDGVYPTPAWLWIIPGVLVMIAAALPLVLLFAFLGAYFPDSQYIVTNLVRVGMFATPIFWVVDNVRGGIRLILYHANPYAYFLELLRHPILDGVAPLWPLAITAGIVCLLWAVAVPLLGALRRRVVFVL